MAIKSDYQLVFIYTWPVGTGAICELLIVLIIILVTVIGHG